MEVPASGARGGVGVRWVVEELVMGFRLRVRGQEPLRPHVLSTRTGGKVTKVPAPSHRPPVPFLGRRITSAAMTAGRTYVASDVHLGAHSRGRERAFRDWLEAAGGDAEEVVINGDLFDFWFEYRTVIPRGHTRVLGTLADLVDAGIRVHLTGGNHDWWGASFLTDEIGVRFHREPVRLELSGRTTLLAHGDGLGAGDRGYRFLQRVIRHPVACTLFRWTHPDLGAWLAQRVSRTEKRREDPTPKQKARIQALEDWAVEQLSADPDLSLVLLGHTHVPVLRQVEAGRFYVNSGDWLRHRSYVILDRDAPPRLERWSRGSAEQGSTEHESVEP